MFSHDLCMFMLQDPLLATRKLDAEARLRASQALDKNAEPPWDPDPY